MPASFALVIGVLLAIQLGASAQPLITRQPQNQAAIAGGAVTFEVEATSATPLRYQWQWNGRDIPRATGRALRRTATPSRAGVYTVKVRDATGEATSGGAKLEVFRRPVILVQPRSIIVGEHTVAEFRVVLNDSGPYTRMIWHNDNPIEGPHEIPPSTGYITDQPILRMENPLNDATWNSTYWFAVTNPAGGVVSRRVRLIVVGAPVLSIQPQHQLAKVGQRVVFNVRVVDNPGPRESFQWYKDGQPIPGATTTRLTLKKIDHSSQANYYCVVTGIGGSTSSWGAHLTVSD